MAESTEAPRLDLHLNTIRDLFVAPDGDPFDPNFSDVSGVDDLVNRLKPRRHKQNPIITVYLPADQITPTLEAETRAALDRYLERRARSAHNDVLSMRRGGIQAFFYALGLTILFAVPLILAYTLDWPEIIQVLSYAAFLVVGWVADVVRHRVHPVRLAGRRPAGSRAERYPAGRPAHPARTQSQALTPVRPLKGGLLCPKSLHPTRCASARLAPRKPRRAVARRWRSSTAGNWASIIWRSPGCRACA